jgi:hypothetical protein
MFKNKLRKRLTLLALSLFVACATQQISYAAIINTPGLTAVRFWEGTGGVNAFTFVQNGPEMTTQIGALLGPSNEDFSQIANENYDVFYSDANGNFNLNGNHVTVEAVYTNPSGGGGLNIAAVDLVFGSGILRADVLSSWVPIMPPALKSWRWTSTHRFQQRLPRWEIRSVPRNICV